jgi:epoxyqueuosine reductase
MEQSLTKKIRQKAFDLGFSRMGIARAESLEREGTLLNEWFRRGYHSSMLWMEKNGEKRADPLKILPQAKSIICVAMNYYSPEKHSVEPQDARISRYAWGSDYHDILTVRISELLDFIREQVENAEGKVYVDTGPVMEKAWAVRSGLGWLGKHTNVITRDFGSWIFLGEIIINLELEYDSPVKDLCGNCTACIDACPTNAIVEPYLVNSNLCISYLTIEHKGEIPKDLSGKFHNWVYGCDICQDVCPWNRFQNPTKEPGFNPQKENVAPSLKELANLTQEEFRSRFRKGPVNRLKLKGLQRNSNAVLESNERSV